MACWFCLLFVTVLYRRLFVQLNILMKFNLNNIVSGDLHKIKFCTYFNPLTYIKSFTLWWRTRMIGRDELEVFFLEVKSQFKKNAAIFMIKWWIIYHSNWNYVPNKMAFSFFRRVKDEVVVAVFLKSRISFSDRRYLVSWDIFPL